MDGRICGWIEAWIVGAAWMEGVYDEQCHSPVSPALGSSVPGRMDCWRRSPSGGEVNHL